MNCYGFELSAHISEQKKITSFSVSGIASFSEATLALFPTVTVKIPVEAPL